MRIREASESADPTMDLVSRIEDFAKELTAQETAALGRNLIVDFRDENDDWASIIIAKWAKSEPLVVLATLREQILVAADASAEEFERKLELVSGVGATGHLGSIFPITPAWNDDRFGYFEAAFRGWAMSDSIAAWDHLKALEVIEVGEMSGSPSLFENATLAIMESLAGDHPEFALKELRDSPHETVKERLQTLIKNLSLGYDLLSVAESLRDLESADPKSRGPGPDLFFRWMKEDSTTALDWYAHHHEDVNLQRSSEEIITWSVPEMLATWTKQLPGEALPWFKEHVAGHHSEMIYQALKLGIDWTEDFQEEMLDIGAQFPEISHRFELMQLAANSYGDPFSEDPVVGANVGEKIILKLLPSYALSKEDEETIFEILEARE